MSLEIVHYNDPVLRKKGEKITVFDEALAAFAEQMIETMHEARGIGLAAQQVGRAIQLCVVDLQGGGGRLRLEARRDEDPRSSSSCRWSS